MSNAEAMRIISHCPVASVVAEKSLERLRQSWLVDLSQRLVTFAPVTGGTETESFAPRSQLCSIRQRWRHNPISRAALK